MPPPVLGRWTGALGAGAGVGYAGAEEVSMSVPVRLRFVSGPQKGDTVIPFPVPLATGDVVSVDNVRHLVLSVEWMVDSKRGEEAVQFAKLEPEPGVKPAAR